MDVGIIRGRPYVVLIVDNAWQQETRLGRCLLLLDPPKQPGL